MSADDRDRNPESKRPNDYDRGDKDRYIRDGRVAEPGADAGDSSGSGDGAENDVDDTRTSDAHDAAVDDAQDRVDADATPADDDDDDRTDDDRAEKAPKPEPFARATKAESGGWNGGGGYSDASVERHRPDDARPDISGLSTGGRAIPNGGAPSSGLADGEQDSDASVERELLAQFGAAGHDVTSVVLSVRRGDATLDGTVADAAAKRALEDLAHASRRVKTCQSRLKVAPAAR